MGAVQNWITRDEFSSAIVSNAEGKRTVRKELCRMQKGKELNDFQRISLEIEILSNLRFGSLEIRDTSVTRVTNKFAKILLHEDPIDIPVTFLQIGTSRFSYRTAELVL